MAERNALIKRDDIRWPRVHDLPIKTLTRAIRSAKTQPTREGGVAVFAGNVSHRWWRRDANEKLMAPARDSV